MSVGQRACGGRQYPSRVGYSNVPQNVGTFLYLLVKEHLCTPSDRYLCVLVWFKITS